ncbi:hypothetical protein TTHERM_00035000 (macronuclear) [Tetrahymena thermophila SB210]|uniref:Uncharacterized protein n=1 Tax=Tetrahymena thermophila (strain SB210) TaxID=312017 RepID=Q22ML9_TETTS|nr:hypothetical protein TTHERM_00035000 [Tetrahymena thermophila SB210]EAR86266.1 hypothetical protein TTHERM_00035000 [Tetrahymena thermophila SB210]|eukprot:XP_977001.1 hypothetical protein TTHERM_00035000 [Tetrahymena thermophila SB210]
MNQKENFDQASQDFGFQKQFKEIYSEEMKEEGQYLNQIQQELDQYNEELESTKSFEIQKDDINEYLDYQSQKTADIQRIRSEIQNLEKEKNYFLSLDKQPSLQRHSFPLYSDSNRNPFKNINIVENHQNVNVKSASNQILLQNIQKENILNKEQFNSNIENKQTSQRNNNSNNYESKEVQQQQVKSNFEGLSLQRGDYSSRNEDNHLSQLQNQAINTQQKAQQQQYQIQQQQITQQMQQSQKLQQADQQDIQQRLESNRALQDDKIKQLEKMIQVQNQFMLGIQNQQEIYYARLYSDIKKQYENLEIQSQKEKKEMEETISQLRKQLKSSQEENQKKQKSLMKILNYYNTLKIDYEKLVSKWQHQQSILINTSSSQNQQQLSSIFAYPYSQGDMEISEYGVSQANLNNLNINCSITSEKVYLRQSKDCQQLEKQAYSNQISSNKELQLTQNSQRENNLSNAYSNPIEQEDDLKQSIDSDGVSIVKGNRSNKSLNANFPSGKQKNPSNGNSNFVQAVSQFKEDQNVRDSYQQRQSFIKSSISAGNTSTSKGTKFLQMYQQQEQFQAKDYEQLEEDINLFCDDDDIVVRQSLENNTKLFDNFFSPRGNKTAQTAKYTITGSTSTSSQDKIFKTDEKILEKQYWSSDFRENAETQPFSLSKLSQIQSQNNLNQGKKGVDGGSNISTKHKSSQSTQQQYQYNNSQFENQPTSLSSQNSLGGIVKNQDKRKSISPSRQQASTRRLTQENKQEDSYQKNQQIEAQDENSSSRYEISQNAQQSQLFKKALQISNKPQNTLFLSHNDNQDLEITNFSKNQQNQYHHQIQTTICSSLEGLPKNSQLTPQSNTQLIGGSIKIQDSFNKLLSKSYSKIPQSNFGNGEVNQSNNNINQENSRKNNNNIDSSSSSNSSQVQQTQPSTNNQKSQKLSSQKLTISTSNIQPNASKISNNFSQVEFNPSPKLIQKKKHFPSQINQSNSTLNQNSYVVTSSNGGGILGTSNSCEANIVNNFMKKEKMVTEPSESTEKSIAKQLSQRQNSSGQSQNKNSYTNNSSDFSHNYNLTDRNTQQNKNTSGSSMQNYNQNAYNNFQKQSSNPKLVQQSQINSVQKKQENQNSGITQNGMNPSISKQQHGNSYQFSQSKIHNMQNAMSSISQYQIKTTFENNYLSPTNNNSIKSKNLITQSQQQTLNVSSQFDSNNNTINNSNANFQANQFQQYGQLNSLNKKLLNDKVNKLIQGKKQTQLNNYNSAATTTVSMNNSENVNLINTSLSTSNHVGMILSPSSRKQLNNQNNLQANIQNSANLQKEYGYTSKQRFHTLEC